MFLIDCIIYEKIFIFLVVQSTVNVLYANLETLYRIARQNWYKQWTKIKLHIYRVFQKTLEIISKVKISKDKIKICLYRVNQKNPIKQKENLSKPSSITSNN